FSFLLSDDHLDLISFPTRRSSDLTFLSDIEKLVGIKIPKEVLEGFEPDPNASTEPRKQGGGRSSRSNNPKKNTQNSNKPSSSRRSEEHTSELQSRENLVCRLLLEK